MKNQNSIIETKIAKGRNLDYYDKRLLRISEAISFNSGSKTNPKKIVIDTIEKGKEVCFFKPGKEAFRENPNIHDMYPCILNKGKNEFENFAFDDI